MVLPHFENSRNKIILQTAAPAKKFSLEECAESRDCLARDADNPSMGLAKQHDKKRSHAVAFLQGKFIVGAAEREIFLKQLRSKEGQ